LVVLFKFPGTFLNGLYIFFDSVTIPSGLVEAVGLDSFLTVGICFSSGFGKGFSN